MLWFARFIPLTVKRTRAALAFTLIAAAACADRVATDPQHAATQRASTDINPSNSFAGFSFAPKYVNAGGVVTGTIKLATPAPPGGDSIKITISRSDLASVDSVVVVQEGHTSQDFLVHTYPTSPIDTVGITLTASRGTCCVLSGGFYIIPGGGGGGGGGEVRRIEASPGSLTFGPRAPGDSSPPQVVTVTNTGNVNILMGISSVSGPFRRTDQCQSVLLAPAHSCTISVVYAPTTSAGAQSGSLTIPSGASAIPNVVTLIGTPTPWIRVTPTAIGWGSVALGNATSGRVVKITSTGTAPFVVSSLTPGGTNPDDFPIYEDGCAGASLSPGASCTAYVSFEPLGIGTRRAVRRGPT